MTRLRALLQQPALHHALIVFLVVFDQATKWLVTVEMREFESIPLLGDLLRLTYIHNTGAAFGILMQQRLLLVTVTVIAVAVMLWYRRSLPAAEVWPRFGLTLIIGGAVGNFIDRLRLGKVIDFLDVDIPDLVLGPLEFFGSTIHWQIARWPAFNVADSAITVGLCFLVWHLWQADAKQAAAAAPESAPPEAP